MKALYVFGDFDWLDSPVCLGELGYESLRGSDSYSFSYNPDWLKHNGNVLLSADLNNYTGAQYTQPGKDIFGCFADALPDRWGKTLLNRREQILAFEEQRPARRLSSYDYLTGIDDFSRIGALRFKNTPDGPFINSDNRLCIPPITDLRALVQASMEFERSEYANVMPEKRWVQQLIHPGTSLGGARPKACVRDENGQLCMAKFPSRNDDYDIALWEHLCHLLAKEAGIDAAQTRVINAGEKYHVLLSKRFDRTSEGKRVHFASALTMLGLTDGCDANTGHGYLDIVDFILQSCHDVKHNLQQLYRRIAFNIATGNTDDHFRNHGFLLTPKGWTLSPAYDMNPTLWQHQSLLINAATNASDLEILLASCEEYMIRQADAQRIISEVKTAVSQWRKYTKVLNIAKREVDMFEQVFSRNCG